MTHGGGGEEEEEREDGGGRKKREEREEKRGRRARENEDGESEFTHHRPERVWTPTTNQGLGTQKQACWSVGCVVYPSVGWGGRERVSVGQHLGAFTVTGDRCSAHPRGPPLSPPQPLSLFPERDQQQQSQSLPRAALQGTSTEGAGKVGRGRAARHIQQTHVKQDPVQTHITRTHTHTPVQITVSTCDKTLRYVPLTTHNRHV